MMNPKQVMATPNNSRIAADSQPKRLQNIYNARTGSVKLERAEFINKRYLSNNPGHINSCVAFKEPSLPLKSSMGIQSALGCPLQGWGFGRPSLCPPFQTKHTQSWSVLGLPLQSTEPQSKVQSDQGMHGILASYTH